MLIQWMRIPAIDVDLGEHRECDRIIAGAEPLDLFGVAGLLAAELIAGKAEHRKSSGPELFLERLKAAVLRREPASARGVHDQQHLTLKVFERQVLAGQRGCGEIVDAAHYSSILRLLIPLTFACAPMRKQAAFVVGPAVIPAKAGIQYAAASRLIIGSSAILDRPPSRAMTRRATFACARMRKRFAFVQG